MGRENIHFKSLNLEFKFLILLKALNGGILILINFSRILSILIYYRDNLPIFYPNILLCFM